MFLIVFSVVVCALVWNIGTIWAFLKNLIKLILPIVIGLIIAFVLNVPMKFFERIVKKMFSRSKKNVPNTVIYLISLILTFICILLVVALAVTIALPSFMESARSIYGLVREKIPDLVNYLKQYNIDITNFENWLTNLNKETLLQTLTSGAGTVISSVVNIASATVSGVVSFLFAIVIAIYVLLSKDSVARQSKKIVYFLFKQNIADKICEIFRLTGKIYSQYLSGQCIEACILGTLMGGAFAIFRLPYAGIIGIITGISAFIPYIGAFVACGFGAFLILLVNPMQALISIVVFGVVQFIENQFIYPHVVGNSVGLSPLLTLLAALVGGSIMGLFGIIFFIPLTAVAYIVLKEYVEHVLSQKNIKIE